MTLIKGNTFPVRSQLAALGGTWDGVAKGWLMPDDKASEARALVASAPPSAPRGRKRYGSTYTRFNSGAEVYTNRNGRCEDAPCCGCCS